MDFDNQLIEILKLNDNFVDSDGNLINSRIINDALKDDEELLKLLLDNDITKDYFLRILMDVMFLIKKNLQILFLKNI